MKTTQQKLVLAAVGSVAVAIGGVGIVRHLGAPPSREEMILAARHGVPLGARVVPVGQSTYLEVCDPRDARLLAGLARRLDVIGCDAGGVHAAALCYPKPAYYPRSMLPAADVDAAAPPELWTQHHTRPHPDPGIAGCWVVPLDNDAELELRVVVAECQARVSEGTAGAVCQRVAAWPARGALDAAAWGAADDGGFPWWCDGGSCPAGGPTAPDALDGGSL